ncbi:MAG TPA: helix-turn-helix domain-containing protein [Methylomirabilota bacterium]|jgi:excisionase family DNA binding protein
MPIERHYTGAELAELLGLDYETVLHKAQTGEIGSVRVGRLRRFPESAVLDYLDRQRETNVIPLRRRESPPRLKEEAR